MRLMVLNDQIAGRAPTLRNIPTPKVIQEERPYVYPIFHPILSWETE